MWRPACAKTKTCCLGRICRHRDGVGVPLGLALARASKRACSAFSPPPRRWGSVKGSTGGLLPARGHRATCSVQARPSASARWLVCRRPRPDAAEAEVEAVAENRDERELMTLSIQCKARSIDEFDSTS